MVDSKKKTNKKKQARWGGTRDWNGGGWGERIGEEEWAENGK